MNSKIVKLLILLVAVGLLAPVHMLKRWESSEHKVCFKDKCVSVEVAVNDEERAMGLMNRTSLAPDAGMLFIFTYTSLHSFWMKNTLIPLDMIWIDSDRTIVDIIADVPPCKADPCPMYLPKQKALYVLEVNAGKAKEWGLQKGEQLEFRLNI